MKTESRVSLHKVFFLHKVLNETINEYGFKLYVISQHSFNAYQ
jgi:hypothetical protein